MGAAGEGAGPGEAQQSLRASLDSLVKGGVAGLVAKLAWDKLGEVVQLTGKISALAGRIERRLREVAPTLLGMPAWVR